MALYVIASLMHREFEGGWKVSQFTAMVVTDTPDSEEEAAGFFRANFKESKAMAQGWALVGEPYFFEVHHGHLRQWSQYISQEPKEESKKPVLRLVKND